MCTLPDPCTPPRPPLPQVYIQTQGAPSLSLSISRDEYPDAPLVLRGINSQGALSQQYQPILMMSKSYTLHWSGPAPREVVLSLINFDKWVTRVSSMCEAGYILSLGNNNIFWFFVIIINWNGIHSSAVLVYFFVHIGNILCCKTLWTNQSVIIFSVSSKWSWGKPCVM